MKKKLFQEVFAKAVKQSGKKSKHGLSTYLERVFMDEFRFSVSKMTFVRYYEKYIDERRDKGNNPNLELLDKLSQYLGYIGYEDFVSNNEGERKGSDRKRGRVKNYIVALGVSIVLILGFVLYMSITKQRWMVWQGNYYVEVGFDAVRYRTGQLKLYDQAQIENFRKVNPDCHTEFFKESGEVNLWYGKNDKGELEYFTALDKHPETGKTLKQITDYMIKKYICKE